MLKHVITIISAAALAFGSAGSLAIETDFKQEIRIKSDNQGLDDIKQLALFVGNVTIQQGTMKIIADRLEVDRKNGRGEEIFSATGKPASYQQQTEKGFLVTASANLISYDAKNKTLTLEGNAKLQQDASKVESERIFYDLKNRTVSASGQVETVFSPSTDEQ